MSRWAIMSTLFAIGALALITCKDNDTRRTYGDNTCTVGSNGCNCTPGGGCDPGLDCISDRCVVAGDALAGDPTGGDPIYTSCSAGCGGGEVCVDEVCRTICSQHSDCEDHEYCGADDLCAPGSRTAPIILAVDGDGSADGTAGQAPHRLSSGLVISGENFTDATVEFGPTGASLSALSVAANTATRIDVLLPNTVTPGEYTLRVVTGAGEDQAGLYLLQGEQGPQGEPGVAGPGSRVVYTGTLDANGDATVSVPEIALADMPVVAGYVFSNTYAEPGYVQLGNIIPGDGTFRFAAGAANANANYILVVVK